jgi:hypothetical protein
VFSSLSNFKFRALTSSVALVLLFGSLRAHADIKYPTEQDLRGFQTVCAGGNVKEIKGNLDAALQTWRLKPGAAVHVDGAIKDLGAVLEKVKSGDDSKLYDTYVDCVRTLILSYLQQANAGSR